MVKFPCKRVLGLLGPPRSGKDEVAKYLQESRNFVSIAFADKIKEEFGITNENFETAKITGEIDRLRKELWDFSAQKKKNDPEYFIKLVMKEVSKSEQSVVITDVRTEDEFNSIFEISDNIVKRVYAVGVSTEAWVPHETYDFKIKDSKISRAFYSHEKFIKQKIRCIENKRDGLYKFYKYLDDFFFKEDIMDLVELNSDKIRAVMLGYISQFNITEIGH